MPVSFLQACREFFGYQPGQKPIDFAREIKALTQKDRIEIAIGLRQNGFDVDSASVEISATKV